MVHKSHPSKLEILLYTLLVLTHVSIDIFGALKAVRRHLAHGSEFIHVERASARDAVRKKQILEGLGSS